jgi:hypothetical protein
MGRSLSHLKHSHAVRALSDIKHSADASSFGAGVLAYFAGAGVCSTPAALICAVNYCRTSAKNPESIDEKVNTRIDTP